MLGVISSIDLSPVLIVIRSFNHFGVAYPIASQRALEERDVLHQAHTAILTSRVEL